MEFNTFGRYFSVDDLSMRWSSEFCWRDFVTLPNWFSMLSTFAVKISIFFYNTWNKIFPFGNPRAFAEVASVYWCKEFEIKGTSCEVLVRRTVVVGILNLEIDEGTSVYVLFTVEFWTWDKELLFLPLSQFSVAEVFASDIAWYAFFWHWSKSSDSAIISLTAYFFQHPRGRANCYTFLANCSTLPWSGHNTEVLPSIHLERFG